MRRAAWKHGKNRKPMKRSAPMKRAGKIKPKARTAGEFARVYGSRARVAWVKALPCVACGRGPCDNAHTETGGMGRKADAHTIVPLCAGPNGCHANLHRFGIQAFERKWDLFLSIAADVTEQAWNMEGAA